MPFGEEAVALARSAVEAEVRGGRPIDVPDPGFDGRAGAFVTLSTFPRGDLRGCIGIPLPVMPLRDAIVRAGRSACHDPRFPDLTEGELGSVNVEVTVLSPPRTIRAGRPEDIPDAIEIGRDGLILEYMGASGLFLPQVPVEQGWDAEEYLDHLCLKAGLRPGMWRSPGARVSSFTGEAWHETEPRGRVVGRDDIGHRDRHMRPRLRRR